MSCLVQTCVCENLLFLFSLCCTHTQICIRYLKKISCIYFT
uniref:Uncharacterized protein n=1 Tax=Rhizophora mucronata TaxID=61149 RepID=A0A2P2PPT0_RHIMU